MSDLYSLETSLKSNSNDKKNYPYCRILIENKSTTRLSKNYHIPDLKCVTLSSARSTFKSSTVKGKEF